MDPKPPGIVPHTPGSSRLLLMPSPLVPPAPSAVSKSVPSPRCSRSKPSMSACGSSCCRLSDPHTSSPRLCEQQQQAVQVALAGARFWSPENPEGTVRQALARVVMRGMCTPHAQLQG